jgi:hypothetical protein
VGEQSLVSKTADHPADGRRRDREPLGDVVRRGGARAPLDLVDDLEVILDGTGQLIVPLGGGHGERG